MLVSRRQLLRSTAVGFGHLALASLLADEVAAGAPSAGRPADPLAPRPPHFSARAKRVIFLFMAGGPSHVDTFEYKPLLQRDHGRPYPFARPRVIFNATGNLLVLDAFMGTAEQARPAIESNRVGLVVICRGNAETALLTRPAPAGLLAALIRGEPPDWLEKLPQAAGEPVEIYRVRS